jgi:hypothetical protein
MCGSRSRAPRATRKTKVAAAAGSACRVQDQPRRSVNITHTFRGDLVATPLVGGRGEIGRVA